ncbi:hypothetical protein NQ314_017980 [Rhamnusium bicolor]|uniref:FERM domain-containing protein n=1 Tax=Rhamnusium bicolor TaxID=1586634 RepID=A0AAV8WSV7_9CUCU|nr:hypothetical protein NQ314_017980 [Rhamnusium bicolor]
MEVTDFPRGRSPLKTTRDVINADKKISETDTKLDKLTRQIAEQCPEGSTKKDLLAYSQPSYVASTKYQTQGTVTSPIVVQKMKAPERKPLVRPEKPEKVSAKFRKRPHVLRQIASDVVETSEHVVGVRVEKKSSKATKKGPDFPLHNTAGRPASSGDAELSSVMTHASVPPELRKTLGIFDSLVRLSVGIEDVEDLVADLEQAKKKLIIFVDSNVTETIVFNLTTTVHDSCRIIREKCAEASRQPKDYGLFLTDEDNKTGIWLAPARNLEYYLIANGDTIKYRKKLRILYAKMLDGAVKTMLVNDSQIVANLMVVICTKLEITKHGEYFLVLEDLENQENIKHRNYGTLTLKRKKVERKRDAKTKQLRKKLHIEEFFFSEQNNDSRDTLQLNLFYVQARDAILNGTHLITQDKACEFTGIQCQNQFGDCVESKPKPGFLDLKEFLPQSCTKMKGVEKNIFSEHRKFEDHSAVGAAITTIGSNLPEITKNVKMIAALMDDGNIGEKWLDTTRNVCHAFSNLLKAAEPECKEPSENLRNAASRVGEANT